MRTPNFSSTTTARALAAVLIPSLLLALLAALAVLWLLLGPAALDQLPH